MARAAEAGDARLSALITRAEAGGRDPDRAIDWSRRPHRPPLIPPRLYRVLVSQLYHGERATLAMCERLMRELPDAGARRFIATQAADETRHAQLYARYLDGIGGLAPTDDAVQRTFDAALAWDGPWQGLVAAAHVVLESETVRLLQHSHTMFACPLLRDINARVVRDEARHLAFGRLYLKQKLGELSPSERRRIYRWVHGLWHECVYSWRGPLTILSWVNRGALRRLWQRHDRELCDVGLTASGDAHPR